MPAAAGRSGTFIFANGENENRVLPPQPTLRTEKDIGSENPETTAVSGFCYSELQFTNDQAFLDAFQKLYGFMEPLSVDATQQASQVLCDLCSETERMAFIIGLHAGVQFAWEVTEPTEVKL